MSNSVGNVRRKRCQPGAPAAAVPVVRGTSQPGRQRQLDRPVRLQAGEHGQQPAGRQLALPADSRRSWSGRRQVPCRGRAEDQTRGLGRHVQPGRRAPGRCRAVSSDSAKIAVGGVPAASSCSTARCRGHGPWLGDASRSGPPSMPPRPGPASKLGPPGRGRDRPTRSQRLAAGFVTMSRWRETAPGAAPPSPRRPVVHAHPREAGSGPPTAASGTLQRAQRLQLGHRSSEEATASTASTRRRSGVVAQRTGRHARRRRCEEAADRTPPRGARPGPRGAPRRRTTGSRTGRSRRSGVQPRGQPGRRQRRDVAQLGGGPQHPLRCAGTPGRPPPRPGHRRGGHYGAARPASKMPAWPGTPAVLTIRPPRRERARERGFRQRHAMKTVPCEMWLAPQWVCAGKPSASCRDDVARGRAVQGEARCPSTGQEGHEAFPRGFPYGPRGRDAVPRSPRPSATERDSRRRESERSDRSRYGQRKAVQLMAWRRRLP